MSTETTTGHAWTEGRCATCGTVAPRPWAEPCDTDRDVEALALTEHVQVHPTDVWVCLRSGVWNLTNGDPTDHRIPSRTTRAIMRGLLLAAIETLDEIDESQRFGITAEATS